MTKEDAIKEIRRWDFLNEKELDALQTLIPELAESEDERIRKAILGLVYLDGIEPILTKCSVTRSDILLYLEKQKENIEKEYVFRPLAGTDITIAAEQAIRRVSEGDRLVLAFNGAYIPVRKGCSANKIVNIYDAFTEKQKPANVDYINGIREELLGIEDNAKDIDGLTESQWVAIRAAHRLLGEYINNEQKPVTKFKVGDKLHFKGDDFNILTITGLREDAYLTDSAYGPILFSDQDEWEIVEQKPVDKLVDEVGKSVRKKWALDFINYLDANRFEGKMSVSNAECKDIEEAFFSADWEKIYKYYNKYLQKPVEWSEENKGLDVTDFSKPIHPDIAKVLPAVINELLWGDDEQKEQKTKEE